MRSFLVFLASALLSAGVIANAVIQKKQFYPSVVYISKSNPSMAVIYFQSMILVLMVGKLMRKIFLGTLRAAEFEHLMERFWYALTETCLAFTVFRDDFNPKFIALFTVLLFLKSFHWLAEDRVDYMERSPIIGYIFHVRVASLLSVLGFLDYILIMYAYQSTLAKGATVQLVFGFEYAILITMVANTTIKYVLHASELRSDTPWENKAVFLLYTELVIGLIRVILYIIFVFLMVKIYTLPLFAFRPMYYTIRNFKKALNDVILSRRAIHNMNTLYPDATPEELALSDNICIICREDMVNSSKKLPCGHIFHTLCLRSWFQRQQTCPTCRLNILRTPITAAQPQQPQQPANNVQGNLRANVDANGAGAALQPNQFFNLFNQGGLVNQQAAVNADASASTSPASMAGQVPSFAATAGIPPPFFFPAMPFMAPPTYVGAIPPPPIPANLEQLSDEELRAMEGNQRRHIIERLKLLKNVQTMLNASTLMLNQYQSIVANLPVEPPAPAVVVAAAATESKESTSTKAEPAPTSSGQVEIGTFKIEDLGSEEHVDFPAKSKDISSSSRTDTESSSSTFIATESNAEESSEANEIRRRRLQKFTAN